MAEQVGGIYYEVAADTKPLVDATRVVDRETAKMAASFNVITAAIKIMAVAMTLIKAAQMADDMRLMGARVDVAAGSVEKAATAMRELQRIATATQTSVAANVQVFTRLNQSMLQMGGTQGDTLRLTELLGMAIKVSGASAQESSSAMLQFGQALGSGKLAGDELRSLLENAPYLMRQLADGIGVPIGALKKLGEEGKLTADVVVNALTKAAGQINADFAKMPQTLGAAFTTAVDALQRLIEKTDESTGASATMTGVTKGLGEAMDALAKQIDGVGIASDGLSRSNQIETWASRTRTVMSYLVDAADSTLQKLTAMLETARLLNRLATLPIFKFANREYSNDNGNSIYARSRKIELPTSTDNPDGLTAGERMRAEWDTEGWSGPGAGPARGRVPPPSKLKPPRDTEAEKKAAAAAKKAAEQRNKDYADSLEAQNKIRDEAQELGAKFTMDEQAKKEKEDGDRAARLARLVSGTYAGTLRSAISDIEVLNQAFNEGLITDTGEWADAIRIATAQIKSETKETAEGMSEFAKQAAANIQDTLGNTLESVLSGNFSNIGEMWAQTLRRMAAQAAAARLNSWLFGSDFGSTGAIGGVVGSLFGAPSIAGVRQYGGPASAGSLYRINETGRPEMFTAANGSQYMMPTQSGRVTAADRVGSAGPTVVINQTINVGQGVSRGEVFAAAMQAKDAAKAEIMQTLYRTGRGPYA